MKLFYEFLKALSKKYILKQDTGSVIKDFCINMGLVYIKVGQILATQNFGNIFKESDRQTLSSICDNCNPIAFEEIKRVIELQYGRRIEDIFASIDLKPIGSASISQVHKATLKNGKTVAIKVKRKDITDSVEKDLERIKRLVHKYGKLAGLKNLTGGDKALELYLSWIKEEIDFENEKQNIKDYGAFADCVNGKVRNTKDIKVPKVYDELCTSNIIVMDYVDSKTINQLELNEENKQKVADGINSYLQLSFYALFNDKRIILHGDPHGANIFIDENGNIGFLDMGLIFELSKEDSKLTREFFLSAYSNNNKKLCDMLIPYGNLDPESKANFERDVALCLEKIKGMSVTSYFTEMISVVAKYDMVPPVFLFNMAKAFVCLNGINVFTDNLTKATELLKEQAAEFYINQSVNDTVNLAVRGLSIAPRIITNTLQYGLSKSLAMESTEITTIQTDFKQALNNYREILNLLISSSEEEAATKIPYQHTMNRKKER